ncbi:carotenoid oxygenase [Tricladium varicosporioides]|nr:carotenoid oxygenase [Hymenoscyphus varicosporioides]
MKFVYEKLKKLEKLEKPHPYLHGNFAPIHQAQPLTPCSYTGTIPRELAGGEYVRNGGNPVTNEDLGRDAHWFDGDGMLSGVVFQINMDGSIRPEFVNQYILTDTYISAVTTSALRSPILPSISIIVNPASTLLQIILKIFRTIFLVIFSNLPGSEQAIRKLSVANTNILYHDGRALATCESGPPIRVSLPGLETVGWFDGCKAEGEPTTEEISGTGFGGEGLMSFMKEWTTAHPRVDPITKELILFHSTFFAPFINYSIIPSTQNASTAQPRLVNVGVPGIQSAKMMHDFGVSFTHTVIMDLPLSLDPRNLAKNQPVLSFNPSGRSRFGVFPRWNPQAIRWFETNPCCIFHTANTWDDTEYDPYTQQVNTAAVNMLACRLTSASLIFSAGDIAAPVPLSTAKSIYPPEEEQCRLYYYRFSLKDDINRITDQFALTSIPFEFPCLRGDTSMSAARYIYGCSVSNSSFGAALGRAVKIDSLVKVDIKALIARAKSDPPTPITGCVDNRTVAEILRSNDQNDPIKIFKLPPGFYAQESRFVPRNDGKSEDDGWALSYVFDESQLDANGNAPSWAKSELWVIDAKDMKKVVCRVMLPQRIPYGFHGNWFSEEEILGQREVQNIRCLPSPEPKSRPNTRKESLSMDVWIGVRRWILTTIG